MGRETGFPTSRSEIGWLFQYPHSIYQHPPRFGFFPFYPSYGRSILLLSGILHECPQLEELALRNLSDVDCAPCFSDSEDFDFPTLTKIVHLPKLKKASFYYAGIALTQQLMAQFTFPNLESLDLCYLENVTPVLQLVYTQALTRLPLRRLRIESSLFNELKLVNLLRRLPSLVMLELVDCEDASSGLLRVCAHFDPALHLADQIFHRAYLLRSLGSAPSWSRSPSMDVHPSIGTRCAHSLNQDYPPTPMRTPAFKARRLFVLLNPQLPRHPRQLPRTPVHDPTLPLEMRIPLCIWGHFVSVPST